MEQEEPVQGDLLIQDLVYAGLTALQAGLPLDLCAYLHSSGKQAPQLFLGAPDLASIDPSDAFSLFNSLRDVSDDFHDGDQSVRLGKYLAVAVTTEGPQSRGLHVAGRLERDFAEHERQAIVRLARSIGAVVHMVEGAVFTGSHGSAPTPIRVSVETIDNETRAEVSAPFGVELRTGAAQAQTPSRAVALAVIDACDASLRLRDTTEEEIAGERVVLVLMDDEKDHVAIGSSVIDRVGGDPLRAIALAALQAASQLASA